MVYIHRKKEWQALENFLSIFKYLLRISKCQSDRDNRDIFGDLERMTAELNLN